MDRARAILNLKVAATETEFIEVLKNLRRNIGKDTRKQSQIDRMDRHLLGTLFRGCHRQPLYCFYFDFRYVTLVRYVYIYIYIYIMCSHV